MDLTLLYEEFYQNKILTDLELTIQDTDDNIVINVHKLVLCLSSPFFRALLCLSFKEQQQDRITVTVPNAAVCYDIIMSFYGRVSNMGKYSEIEHEVWSIICSDYWEITPIYHYVENSTWSIDDLDFVISLYHQYRFNERLVRLVYYNLPTIYPMENLSADLREHLLTLATKPTIVVCGDQSIAMFNDKAVKGYSSVSYMSYTPYYLPLTRYYFYQCNDKIALIKYNRKNRADRTVIVKTNKQVLCTVSYSRDETLVVFVLRRCDDRLYQILLYHMNSGEIGLSHSFATDSKLLSAALVANNTIIYLASKTSIIIGEMDSGLFHHYHLPNISKMDLSLDSTQLCVQDATTNVISIYDMTKITHQLNKQYSIPYSHPDTLVCYLPDAKQLLLSPPDHKPYICHLVTNEIIYSFQECQTQATHLSWHEQYIIIVEKLIIYLFHNQTRQLERTIQLKESIATTSRFYYSPIHDAALASRLKIENNKCYDSYHLLLPVQWNYFINFTQRTYSPT